MVHATPRTRYRIRLINPNSPLTTITLQALIQRMTLHRRKAIFAPTGLTICARVMPEHWDVEVVDECVMDRLHMPRADCDVVGITAMTTQARRAYELGDAYRKLGVTVIMGGIHPSALPEDALPHCDTICKGDAEATLPYAIADWERARECEGGKGSTFAGQSGEGLSGGLGLKRIYDWADSEPVPIATPRKDLLDAGDYIIANPIQTTRGCPHTCSFCTTPGVFGRRYRQREIADIVEEIREAKERCNTKCFIFADDNFGGNHKWAIELCAALEPLKIRWASQCDVLISRDDRLLSAMKRSGCLGLILGLESRKQDTLSEAGKRYVQSESYEWRIRKIQSYQISLWGAFIFGFDHDTWQDMMTAVRWAQRMDLSMSCYPILTPYPGTEIYDRYERDGRLTTHDWTKYNGATVVFRPKHLSPAELAHAQLAAFAEFYSLRSSIQRLRFLPFKKYAWLANLAIANGIRFYYAWKGRQIPRFSDFQDRGSRAWLRAGRSILDEPEVQASMPVSELAASVVGHSDPLHQASLAVAAMDNPA